MLFYRNRPSEMLCIPPELNICSARFDPARALACRNLPLAYPNAKAYNNISEYYSRTFLKKKNFKDYQNQGSKAAKNQQFILKRNYDWFYSTLGVSRFDGERIRQYNEARRKQKRFSFGKCLKDKLKNAIEISPENLEPLQSEKIIQKDAAGSSILYFLRNGRVKRAPSNFRNDNYLNPSSNNQKRVSGSKKKSVYYYGPHVKRALYTLKYNEHIHTLYSLRQKTKELRLSKFKYVAKTALKAVSHSDSDLNVLLESVSVIPGTEGNTHSLMNSGSTSSDEYSTEETDAVLIKEFTESTKNDKVLRKKQDHVEELNNQHPVMVKEDNPHEIGGLPVEIDPKPKIPSIKSSSMKGPDATNLNSSSLHLEDVSCTKDKDRSSSKVEVSDHDAHVGESPKRVDGKDSKLGDHDSEKLSELFSSEIKETKEQALLRKAREAREMIRLMRSGQQKDSNPRLPIQNAGDVHNSKNTSLQNVTDKSSELCSVPKAALVKNTNFVSSKIGENTSINCDAQAPIMKGSDNCVSVTKSDSSKLKCMSKCSDDPSKQTFKKTSDKSLVDLDDNQHGKKIAHQENDTEHKSCRKPVKVCINLKMINATDLEEVIDVKNILKDHNVLASDKVSNSKNDSWKGYRIPKKKLNSTKTTERSVKKLKVSGDRGLIRVIRN